MPNTKISITSWNVEGRLSVLKQHGRGNTTQIVNNIADIGSDIFVLLEAHTENSLEELSSLQRLKELGYKTYNAIYDDDSASRCDSYAPKLSMMLLSKYPVKDFMTKNLGKIRNCFIATVETNAKQLFRVIGVHLDDRNEANRLNQIVDLSRIINESKLPTIVLGDFNAMHGEDLWPARFLTSGLSRFMSNVILPSVSKRAIEMAYGETLRLLELNTGLIDIDISHQPTTTPKMRNMTFMPSIRLIQIDHIYASDDISPSNFQISADGGSDHRAISTEIVINKTKI